MVQFYGPEADLVASVVAHLQASLDAGGTAIAIATAPHLEVFEAALREAGVDAEGARAAGTLVLLDAADTLATFIVDGRLDGERFEAVIGSQVQALADVGPLAAYGEMVALLWDEGQVSGAVELETMWNRLAEQIPFSLLCAYPLASVGDDDHIAQLHAVCHEHTHVVGSVDDRGRGVSSQRFEGTAGVTAARHFVDDALAAAGLHRITDEVAIVVTELTTNAVLHAGTPFTVTVLIQQDTVRLAVRDHSTAFPQPRQPTPTSLGGRGLGLVGAVARWGVEAVAGGKTVWAELSG